MSSDLVEPPGAEGSGRVRYRATVIGVLCVLSLFVMGASYVTLERGPRVRAVTVDVAGLVERPGSVATFEIDQPLNERSLDGARIEPEVAADFSISGSTVNVRFTGVLDYGQHYLVTIPALRSAATGRQSAFEQVLSTPPLEGYIVERGGVLGTEEKSPDRIVRYDLTDGTSATVAAHPIIQEYAVVDDDAVAAVVLDDDGFASVAISQLSGGDIATQELPLARSGAVNQLRASARTGHLGFVFTGEENSVAYTSTLFVAETDNFSDGATPVLGIDGKALQVTDWEFVPATAYAVAHSFDGALYLIDATGATEPRLLGQHGGIDGFLPGTASIVVSDPSGLSALDLTTGDTERLTLPLSVPDVGRKLALLDNQTMLTVPDERGSDVVRQSTDFEKTIYRTPETNAWVRDVCVSTNARIAAVELVDPASQGDGYPALGAWTGIKTVIIDAKTGRVLDTLPGFQPNWCH